MKSKTPQYIERDALRRRFRRRILYYQSLYGPGNPGAKTAVSVLEAELAWINGRAARVDASPGGLGRR